MDTKIAEIVPCRTHLLGIVAAVAALVLSITVAQPGAADRHLIERGKHLIAVGGAWTAISPATASSTPDMNRFDGAPKGATPESARPITKSSLHENVHPY
jgi:hypothetical protein